MRSLSAALLLLAACASSRVTPGARVDLPPGQGVLVVGAGDGVRIQFLRLQSPSSGSELIVSGLEPHALALYAVSSDTYCIVEVVTSNVQYGPLEPAESKWCVQVPDRHFGYAGHVSVRELESIEIKRAPADACVALKRDYSDALRTVAVEGTELAGCTSAD